MGAVSRLAVNGIRYGILGGLASLAVAAPLVDGSADPDAHTDASRIGYFFDRTVGAEKIGYVVMGSESLRVFATRVEAVHELSAPNGLAGMQTLGINQTISAPHTDSVVIGDDAVLTGASPSVNNVVMGRGAGASDTTNAGRIVLIGGQSYANMGACVVIGATAGADRSFGVTVGRNAYGGGSGNVVIGDDASGGSISPEDSIVIGRQAWIDGTESVAIGAYGGSEAIGGTAVGYSAYTDSLYGIALGHMAYSAFDYSVAIGAGVTTTAIGQIRLGSAANYTHVVIGMTTSATDSTTGALQVVGGISTQDVLYAAGNIWTDGAFRANRIGLASLIDVTRIDGNGPYQFWTANGGGRAAWNVRYKSATISTRVDSTEAGILITDHAASPISLLWGTDGVATLSGPLFYDNTISGLAAADVKSAIDELALSQVSSAFAPVLLDETDVVSSEVVLTKDSTNLIAVDVDEVAHPSYDIAIADVWTVTEVGTFRLDLVVNVGQSIGFLSGGIYMTIDNLLDLDVPASGVVSLLFDKPYGTTTWYVRQSV